MYRHFTIRWIDGALGVQFWPNLVWFNKHRSQNIVDLCRLLPKKYICKSVVLLNELLYIRNNQHKQEYNNDVVNNKADKHGDNKFVGDSE